MIYFKNNEVTLLNHSNKIKSNKNNNKNQFKNNMLQMMDTTPLLNNFSEIIKKIQTILNKLKILIRMVYFHIFLIIILSIEIYFFKKKNQIEQIKRLTI